MAEINQLASQLRCSPTHIRQAAEYLGCGVDSQEVAAFVAEAKENGGVPALIRQRESQASRPPSQSATGNSSSLGSFSDLISRADAQARTAQQAVADATSGLVAASQWRGALATVALRRQGQALASQLDNFVSQAGATLAQLVAQNATDDLIQGFWECVDSQPALQAASAEEAKMIHDLIKNDAVAIADGVQRELGMSVRLTDLRTGFALPPSPALALPNGK